MSNRKNWDKELAVNEALAPEARDVIKETDESAV